MSHPDDLEAIARTVVDCGYRLHRDLGPGLLESVYEILLAEYLKDAGLTVGRQVPVPISYKGIVVEMPSEPILWLLADCWWNSNRSNEWPLSMAGRC